MSPQLRAYTGPLSGKTYGQLEKIAAKLNTRVQLYASGPHITDQQQIVHVPQNQTLALIDAERPIPPKIKLLFYNIINRI